MTLKKSRQSNLLSAKGTAPTTVTDTRLPTRLRLYMFGLHKAKNLITQFRHLYGGRIRKKSTEFFTDPS